MLTAVSPSVHVVFEQFYHRSAHLARLAKLQLVQPASLILLDY